MILVNDIRGKTYNPETFGCRTNLDWLIRIYTPCRMHTDPGYLSKRPVLHVTGKSSVIECHSIVTHNQETPRLLNHITFLTTGHRLVRPLLERTGVPVSVRLGRTQRVHGSPRGSVLPSVWSSPTVPVTVTGQTVAVTPPSVPPSGRHPLHRLHHTPLLPVLLTQPPVQEVGRPVVRNPVTLVISG